MNVNKIMYGLLRREKLYYYVFYYAKLVILFPSSEYLKFIYICFACLCLYTYFNHTTNSSFTPFGNLKLKHLNNYLFKKYLPNLISIIIYQPLFLSLFYIITIS